MTTSSRGRLVAASVLILALTLGLAVPRGDVADAPTWRLAGTITTAAVHGNTVYVGGTFSQLFTPSSSQDQFYDLETAQVRPQCARSTNPSRELGGVPDGRGGLLVTRRSGDAFADANGEFAPPEGTTIVRIGTDCLWDRGFAAPAIDPGQPDDLRIGVPVPVGGRILASNTVLGPDFFQRAQVATFDAQTGARIAFQFYQGVAEIGFLGPGPQAAVARVRTTADGVYRLGSVSPLSLALNTSSTVLLDEVFGPRVWFRGTTMFRARPAPSNTLEAYDLTTLAARGGWTPPVVPTLNDLEVVGTRVFLTAGRVNGQTRRQPSALLLASGAIDTSWNPPLLAKRIPDPSTPYEPVLTALATDGQRLYMSGDFERVATIDREGIAALAVSTGALDRWDPAPLVVQPLEYTQGGLLMTRPTGTNRVTRRFLAAVDRTDGEPLAWNPNDPARTLLHTATPVAALAADAAFVYFASATSGEILRAAVDGAEVDQNWRLLVRQASGQPGSVATMTLHEGVLYIGGEFETISGPTVPASTRRSVAAVGVDGVLRPWAPAITGESGIGSLVRALLPLGTTIHLGGDFTAVNASPRLGYAAVDHVMGQLVQPEMFVLGDTRINGLATDGERMFIGGTSFGAPLVGEVSIPDSLLTTFASPSGVTPSSVAVVRGRFYAGLEYDVEAQAATSRPDEWGQVLGDGNGLLHFNAEAGTIDYYEALPGTPPGAPTLSASVVGNTVYFSWLPGAGGAASRYTLVAGSAPGAYDLAAFAIRGSTTFAVTAPNGRYYVAVMARNADGASPFSNEVAVQVGPPPCTLPPTAPGPITYTTAGRAVSLAWGESPTAAAYVLDAGWQPGATDIGSIPLGRVTSVVLNAPPGTYYVRMRALSACGVSPASSETAVVVSGGVPLPQAPTAVTASVTGNNVSIAWTPPVAGGTPSGYFLEAGYAPGAANAGAIPTAQTTIGVSGVPAATYYVRVRAYNAAGLGPASAEISLTVP